MYNNHQGGVYTIRGDMCYENKIMTNSALSVGSPRESVCLSLENDSPTDHPKQRGSKVRLQYVVNAFLIIIVGVTLALIEFDVIPTNRFGYYCNDPMLSHPFKGDTISATALVVGSFLGPIVILSAVEFKRSNHKYTIRVIWKWYKELLIGLATVLLVTEVMKAVTGAQRPHFITTCQPDTEKDCTAGTFIPDYTCTGTGYSFYFVGDSTRSFPSGHTSISVFVSLYCAAFIHCRFTSRRFGQLLKPFLIVVCLIWGAVCGLTRVTDRRHHWWDVLAGAIFGAIGAAYAIVILANKFRVTIKENRSPRLSPSTTTLIDKKNKDATSVII